MHNRFVGRRVWAATALLAAGFSGLALVVAGCGAPRGAAVGSPQRTPDLTSNLQVDAGQRFVYAGEVGSGSYTASIENRGSVPVTLARRVGEAREPIGGLAPGEVTLAKFARGEAALFENDAADQATLRVCVWGDTKVGMRYEALK
jgi:hypothetical protein